MLTRKIIVSTSESKLFIDAVLQAKHAICRGKVMRTENRYFIGDYLIAGWLAVIVLAEAAHLSAIFLGRSFSDCGMILLALLAACLIAASGHGIVKRCRTGAPQKRGKPFWADCSRAEWMLYAVAGGILLSQIYCILTAEGVYRRGDMTVETVNSFLETNAVYSVNPMTGQPYTEGIPFRLKILCLPTLYGSVCSITGLSAQIVVWRLIPVLTLTGYYFAYGILARSLFPENGKKRACFLAAAALLLWVENYLFGMDGFDVLSCGFRGVSIRNAVLFPWLLSLLLRKKKLPVLLCIFAEACIVWTFYGAGVCAAVAVGMTAAGFAVRRYDGRKEAA